MLYEVITKIHSNLSFDVSSGFDGILIKKCLKVSAQEIVPRSFDLSDDSFKILQILEARKIPESLVLFVITSYSIHYTKLYEDNPVLLVSGESYKMVLPLENNKNVLIDKIKEEMPNCSIGQDIEEAFRITSYNVCYTKLLRIFFGNFSNAFTVYNLFNYFFLYICFNFFWPSNLIRNRYIHPKN